MTSSTTFGETIARLRAVLDSGEANRRAEASRLLREATEIAESYADNRRVLASVVERQRGTLRELASRVASLSSAR